VTICEPLAPPCDPLRDKASCASERLERGTAAPPFVEDALRVCLGPGLPSIRGCWLGHPPSVAPVKIRSAPGRSYVRETAGRSRTGDTSLDEVAEIMGENKYGSVVVMGRDGIVGIFTAVDACKALASVLQRATQ
jgi:hypothetical protein